MRSTWKEYIPKPFSFGIEGRQKLPISKELQTVRQRDAVVISQAKNAVATLISEFPNIVSSMEEVQRIKPENIQGLYAKPARSLIYKSPHNMRHFIATDVLSLFIGKYVNATLAKNGQEPIDIDTLRYGAWTHDSYRTRFDKFDTIFWYQKHGIQASENLEKIARRGGLQLPENPATIDRIKEIDKYHDVDDRPLSERSRELEVFTTIDKLEMVRLFRPIDFTTKVPVVAQGIRFFAKERMKAYEGSRDEFKELMGKFLPIVDGLYRLTMQDVYEKRRNGTKWEDIDQYEAVMKAAQELGMIEKNE